MAGKARTRFIQSKNYRQIVYSDAAIRSTAEYGVTCIYCNDFFSNVKKSNEKYVCKDCYTTARIV